MFIMIVTIFLVSCKKDDGSAHEGKTGNVSDIEGNVYQTVIIGHYEWMAENLKTTRFNDGSNIENPGNNNREWINNRTGAYSWYNNDISNKGSFGALYNWHAVNTGRLCPTGWRVPSDAEWNSISRYLAGERENLLAVESPVPEEEGIDAAEGLFRFTGGGTRFADLPGGSHENNEGYFYYIEKSGRWWTINDYTSTDAWYRSMYIDSDNFYRSVSKKTTGLSIRCIRDTK